MAIVVSFAETIEEDRVQDPDCVVVEFMRVVGGVLEEGLLVVDAVRVTTEGVELGLLLHHPQLLS